MPQSEIQRITLGAMRNYVNGVGLSIQPVIDGRGPFDPVSLDDGSDLISAANLAIALQTELETEAGFTGKVAVVGEDIDDSVTSGCVLRLKLDETSGTAAADSSGNANDGTHTGTVAASTTTAPNRRDSLRSAQYTAAYTSVPNSASLNITGAFSITGWLYWTGGAFAYNPILSKWNSAGTTGFGLSLDGGTSTLRFDSYAGGSGSNIKGDTVLSANTWYFVAATRAAGGAAKVYLNAAVDKSGTLSSAPGSTSDEVRVGSDKSTGGRVWTGLLDDVRLYNRELSADEVAEIMFSGMRLTVTFDASLGDVPEMTIGLTGASKASLDIGGFTPNVNISIPFPSDSTTLDFDTDGSGFVSQINSEPTGWTLIGGGTGTLAIVYERNTPGAITMPTDDADIASWVATNGRDDITATVETIQDGEGVSFLAAFAANSNQVSSYA